MGARKPIKLGGIAIPFNIENKNGRIYTEESFSAECIENMNEALGKDTFLGEINQNPMDENISLVNLSRVSHKINKADIREEGVYVEIEMLDTPQGNIVSKMIDSFVPSGEIPFSVASRGIGTVNDKGEVELEQILSFDIVEKSANAFDTEFIRIVKEENEEN